VSSYSWGSSGKVYYEINNLPPRIIWLCLDWPLSKVHRYMISKYAHILAPPTDGEGSFVIPSYEQIFKLEE